MLTAIGVDRKGNRRILGLSVAQSEAEIDWKEFLKSLVKRGLGGVEYIVSDDHSRLNAGRKAVFADAKRQRCQFHLTQNAKNKAPNKKNKKAIAKDLRTVYGADNLEQAKKALNHIVDKHAEITPELACWLENNVPEAITVFSLSKKHWVNMRTSNMIEGTVNQQIKQKTRKVRVFPNEESIVRLLTSLLIRIENKWIAENGTYIS